MVCERCKVLAIYECATWAGYQKTSQKSTGTQNLAHLMNFSFPAMDFVIENFNSVLVRTYVFKLRKKN